MLWRYGLALWVGGDGDGDEGGGGGLDDETEERCERRPEITLAARPPSAANQPSGAKGSASQTKSLARATTITPAT